MASNAEKTQQLRKFAFLLRVPRLHHEYIERYGVDPFIENFTAVLAEKKAVIDEKKIR